MAGVLNFTLGLGTSQFLGRLGAASAALSSFLGVGLSLNRVWNEIAEGGRLADLAPRISETVANLVKLEAGFKDVGLSAGAVPALVAQIQKSLGGFNEMGEPTKDVFKAIGLSVDDLKKLDAPGQITAIGTALARLPKDDAMSIASKIAGRGGAGDLLQIGRNMDAFKAMMAAAEPLAQIMQRNAGAFDAISTSIDVAGLRLRTFFAGIAEGSAPAIQSFLTAFNSIDFGPIGQKLGVTLAGVTQAFKEGQIADLLGLSIKAGLEQGAAYVDVFFQSLGQSILNWNFVEVLQNSFAKAFNGIALGMNEMLLELAGAVQFISPKVGDQMAQFFNRRRTELLGIDDILGEDIVNGAANVGKNFAEGLGALKNVATTPAMKELAAALAAFSGRALPGAAAGGPQANALARLVGPVNLSGKTLDVNERVKVGLSLMNATRGGTEFQRDIARNTKETAEVLKGVRKALEFGLRVGGVNFDNQ